MAKRLDRIAPACDRAYIGAAYFLSLLCAVCIVALLYLHYNVFSAPIQLRRALLVFGYSTQAVSLFILGKELIRNRFYSAVLALFLSLLLTAALIVITVL